MRNIRWIRVVVLSGAVVLAARPASADDDRTKAVEQQGVAMYLEIDGVAGDARGPGLKKPMEILAWSWGLSNTACSGPRAPQPRMKRGNAGTQIQDISLTKYQDSATAALLDATARRRVLKRAVLTVARKKMPNKPYLRFTMENVHVSSVSMGGSGGEDRFTENITLRFDKIRFENAKLDGERTGRLNPPFIYPTAHPKAAAHAVTNH